MLVSPARDASVCLRCHLRQVLRQIASQRVATKSSFHQQCRLQSSSARERVHDGEGDAAEDGALKPRFTMGAGQRPGRNGKRRRPRFQETTATLPIASMNRQTDIIVLRDLPKEKKVETKPDVPKSSEEGTPPSVSGLTAKEIQSLADQSVLRLSQSEVNSSIESSRFGRDEQIVTRQQFDTKVAELSNAYNLGQLRRYAASQRRFEAVKYTPPVLRPASDEISSSEDNFTIRITPWTPSQADKVVPKEAPRGKAPRVSKLVYAKQLVAEDILRQCWGIEIDSTSAKRGQLDVHLAPIQLSLWMNSPPEALERMQPSSRFYQNSKLQLYPPDHLIRINGPQAEAQSMAFAIREAFQGSSHTTIELGEMSSLVDRDSPLADFAELFSSWQLRSIMAVTGTYIEYDNESKKVHVLGFVDKGVRDASRILLSLLPLPSMEAASTLWPEQHTEACFVLPNASTKALPFSHRSQQLGRVVVPVANNGKNDEKRTKKKDGDDDDTGERENSHNNVGAPLVSEVRQGSIAREVLAYLPEPAPLIKGEESRKLTYWHSAATQMPWKARLGHILQPTSSALPTAFTAPATAVTPSSPTSAFLPQFPANLSILRHIARLPDFRPGPINQATGKQTFVPPPPIRPPTQLVAKLTPSPLTPSGALPPAIFPMVEMIFEQGTGEKPTTYSSNPLRFRGNKKDLLEFRSMHAFLAPQTLALHLPSSPTDIHFSRHQLLRSRAPQSDPLVGDFIREVISSARDTTSTLHAPASLDLKIPAWATKPPGLEESKRLNKEQRAMLRRLRGASRDLSVTYLFSGFEVRERRDFEIGGTREEGRGREKLRVETYSGGVSGGQGVEVSVVAKKSVGVNPRFEDFVSVKRDGEGGARFSVPMPAISRGFTSLPTATAAATPSSLSPTAAHEQKDTNEGGGEEEVINATREKILDEQTVGVVSTSLHLTALIQRIWAGELVVKEIVKRDRRDRTREQQTEIWLRRKGEREERRRERGEMDGSSPVAERDVFEALDLMDAGVGLGKVGPKSESLDFEGLERDVDVGVDAHAHAHAETDMNESRAREIGHAGGRSEEHERENGDDDGLMPAGDDAVGLGSRV